MLQNVSTEEIAVLRAKPGNSMRKVEIPSLGVGALIRIITSDNNCYLFEVADPKKCKAHVVRCEARPRAPKTGYRGERTVSETFEIGKQIDHFSDERSSWTAPVAEIHQLAT